MNKFINGFILTLFVLSNVSAYAINWVQAETQNGKVAFVDKDSLLKKDKYYFYNIKYKTKPQDEFKILTVQSALHNAYSARLKTYTEQEYDNLHGDYQNIANNFNPKLELAVYGSVVHSCHKKVRELMEEEQIPKITIE